MGFTNKILKEVRDELAPPDDVLPAARQRRDDVLRIARRFPGALRTYRSGSIAHGTANADLDGDGGVVLDRRAYPELGPDGSGIGPIAIVDEMLEFISADVRQLYPDVEFELTKRAVQVIINEDVEGFDPSVDVIVALTRMEEPGLWIPNREKDDWDASHPEKHTELFTSGSRVLVRTRARAVRLGKGWDCQYEERALSSFNSECLAYEAVTDGMDESEALAATFRHGATTLAVSNTPDPADVSPPIKLLLDRTTVVDRLIKAANLMDRAHDNDQDEDEVREALADLFWECVKPPTGSTSKSAFAHALTSNQGLGVGAGGLTLHGAGTSLKRTRAHGDAT